MNRVARTRLSRLDDDALVELARDGENDAIEVLLERIAASGVTVHEISEGRYVCKGRRRLTNSHQTASPSMSASASPQLGTSPVAIGSAPA